MPPQPNQFENAQTPASESADTPLGRNEVPKLGGVAPVTQDIGTDFTYKREIVWENAIAYLMFHIAGVIGFFLAVTLSANPLTSLFSIAVLMIGGVGLTMGAHRYFTHRSFKANLITRRILLVLFVINGQNSLWEWARDHRQHHKYSDTDADPHNASRGFFFSHVGWLLSRKHPKVLQFGRGIDMSDLEADSWVMFQKRFFLPIYGLVAIFIPCVIPVLLWHEHSIKSLLVCYFMRTTLGLNFTWFVNSLAHIYGVRPYDKHILPTQNQFVSMVGMGEGWHNYHHAFPWDYRTSEFGQSHNLTASVIDFCASKGWVYDLKTPSTESVKKRVQRTGDNSHKKFGDLDKFAGVKCWGNIWRNPGNPTYTSKSTPDPIKITREGYILYEADKKSE